MNPRPSALDAARAVDQLEGHENPVFSEGEAIETSFRALVTQNHSANDGARQRQAEIEKERDEAEAQRQRYLDEAMADVVEVVRRHRTRLSRKVCSPHDGATIRKIWALLRQMHGADMSADDDPAFGKP